LRYRDREIHGFQNETEKQRRKAFSLSRSEEDGKSMASSSTSYMKYRAAEPSLMYRCRATSADMMERRGQGVTMRCRLSWLTNSALVYELKSEKGGVGGSQPMSTAVHMKLI
jgi:hypothetical protein